MIPTIKSGASVSGLRPEMVFAWTIWCHVVGHFTEGINPVLTEGTGGKHGIRSLHYVGLAMDLRSNSLPSDMKKGIVTAYGRALGPSYQVILEDKDTPNEHIHVEYQP